jgi:hypothetical protein
MTLRCLLARVGGFGRQACEHTTHVHQSASLLGACQLQLYLLRAVGRVTAISRRRSRGLWCVWAHHVAAALAAMGGDWTGQGHPVPTTFS